MLRNIRCLATCTLSVLALAGCGGDEQSSSDPQVIVPQATAVPYEGYENTVGFLESADLRRVVLRSPSGERIVFRVREENLQTIGLDHLASHAGYTDLGFKVYYEQERRRRYIIGAEEVPLVPHGLAPSATSPT